jgi:vacuolar-type H+-ATPase subunit I/STV1
MDPLPLSLNQQQLQLMHDTVSHAIANLQAANQTDQFASGDEKQKEHNLLTYGTNDYNEATALIQEIDDQLKSQLKEWNGGSEEAKPVAIALNSYQVKVLRTSIEQELENSNHSDAQHLLSDIIEQLPESSPNEQSD